MSATTVKTFGNGDWGINVDEISFIIQSQSENYKSESKEVRNRVGNCVGKTFYNEAIEVSVDGVLIAGTPFSGKISSAFTLANPFSAYINEPLANGINLIDTITIDKTNEDYKKIKISSIFYPYFNA